MHNLEIIMLAKKTSKNQITLPKAIVSDYPGIDYFEISSVEGRIILEPIGTYQANAVREKLEQLGVSERDVKYAIRKARKK